MSIRRLIAGFFLVLFTALAGVTAYALWPERAEVDPAWLAAAERYDVRIRRDGFGVPYIHGRSDADAFKPERQLLVNPAHAEYHRINFVPHPQLTAVTYDDHARR